MAKFRAGEQLSGVGEFINERRRAAQLSLRQLAEQAGISNPYLSQIERGLRRPSAEVLQQLAKGLRISAESLYVRAGILDPEGHRTSGVSEAIAADAGLNDRQKRLLLDLYATFESQNSAEPEPDQTNHEEK